MLNKQTSLGCGENDEVKGPSLPSPSDLLSKSREEDNAAFFYLSVSGQNREGKEITIFFLVSICG